MHLDKKDLQTVKKLDLKIIIFNIVEKLFGLKLVHKLFISVSQNNFGNILENSEEIIKLGLKKQLEI